MPNSSLCCHICKCQSPHCLLLVHLLLVNPLIALSSLSMPISSVPISSLPSHPCPSLPFPDLCLCTSPHCPIISSIHISLLMPIWFLLYLFLMMQILTALFSRLSVVDFLKFHCAKWNEKKSHTFYFFFQKNERSRMSKLCKNGKYLCEYEDGEVKTLYDAFKRGARVSSKNME